MLVVGAVAAAMPEAFDGLDVTILRGRSRATAVEARRSAGRRANARSTWARCAISICCRFPTGRCLGRASSASATTSRSFPPALIQQSRGCTLKCNYCPYIILENATRLRTPESVAAEMRAGIKRHGFRSFKFRDPLFGVDRKRVFRLAELIGGLPRKIQFSIEGRIDLLQARRAQGAARGRADEHHGGHRDARGRHAAAIPPGADPRRPAARVSSCSAAGWAFARWPAS